MEKQCCATLNVTSPVFEHNGYIPKKYTGYGEDISPPLLLSDLSKGAVSIAIIMNDNSHPVPAYNHWVIWNIPAQNEIPQNIAHGEQIEALDHAVQGIGYGKHRYRGPKPPFFMRKAHYYEFHVYVLDCKIDLHHNAKKAELLKAMQGHIMQYGSMIGLYRNGEKAS